MRDASSRRTWWHGCENARSEDVVHEFVFCHAQLMVATLVAKFHDLSSELVQGVERSQQRRVNHKDCAVRNGYTFTGQSSHAGKSGR